MKNMYTWAARPVRRNLTVVDMRAAKGVRKLVQVTANSEEEASAAAVAGLDLIICNAVNVDAVRRGNDELFLTAALGLPDYPTESDVLRDAFGALEWNATARRPFRGALAHSLPGPPETLGHLKRRTPTTVEPWSDFGEERTERRLPAPRPATGPRAWPSCERPSMTPAPTLGSRTPACYRPRRRVRDDAPAAPRRIRA